jgi:hypothetical protein
MTLHPISSEFPYIGGIFFSFLSVRQLGGQVRAREAHRGPITQQMDGPHAEVATRRHVDLRSGML